MSKLTERLPGSRLVLHAGIALLVWAILSWFNQIVDPLLSYYLATAAMYATVMFGMTILVGLSGQVSLGNGALMAVGGYIFALTSLNWQTVPVLGLPWNAVWSMVFAGIGGVVFGLLIGGIAARLRGPYLAGLTLGIAVGVPAIVNRFPGLLGGENGFMLQVPYPAGGYAADASGQIEGDDLVEEGTTGSFDEPVYEDLPEDFFDEQFDEFSDDFSDDEFLDDEFFEDEFFDDEFDLDADAGADSGALTDPPLDIDQGIGGLDAGFILEQWQASMAIAVACIVGFVALNLVRGRQGRVWQAVRDDPVAAAVSGISPAGSKVSAFVVSSLFAALGGAVFAQILSFVGPGAFTLGLSLSLLVGIVLGGRNSLIGAMIGAVILVWLPEFVLGLSADRGWADQITNNAPNLIYGLLVVAVVLAAPGGLTGSIRDLARRLSRSRVSRTS